MGLAPLGPPYKRGSEEAADAVRPLLGPLGRITPLPATRQLNVMDTAGRTRQIRDVLKRLEGSKGSDGGVARPERSDGRVESRDRPATPFAKPQGVPPRAQSAATGEAPAGVDIFGTSPKMKRIRAALAEPTVMDLDNKSFANVIDYLKQRHKIEIQFDRKALEEAGFDTNKQVTIHMKELTLRSALRLLLRPGNLTYVIQDDVLLITTTDEASNKLTTMVCPVGDLVLPQGASSAEDADFDSLIGLITSTVQPTTWDKAGGPGTISAFKSNRTLVLSQMEEVHEDVAKLLETLRTVKAGKGGVLPARRPGGAARPERGDGRGESLEGPATPFAEPQPQGVPPRPAAAAGEGDRKALLGPWKVVRVEKGGAADSVWKIGDTLMEVAAISGLSNFEKNTTFFFALHSRSPGSGGMVTAVCNCSISPQATPRTITLSAQSPQPSTEPAFIAKGIYELQGERLKICLTRQLPAKPESYPKSFAIDPNSRDVLLVLERHAGGAARNAEQARAIAEVEKLRGTSVKSARLAGWFVTDAAIAHLEGLTQLESLSLGHAQVTDVGMKHLEGLTNLQSLDLTFTKVTDAGLEHIRGLTKLKALDLHGVGVTDAGLEQIEGLTNLRELSLYNTAITDAGLEKLKGLTQLQTLDLGANKITGAGFKHLEGFTQLQSLNLIWTGTTDAALAHLKSLSKLQSLNLYATEVTDAGLEHLRGLPNLRSLELWRTKVTDTGLVHLKALTRLRSLGLAETKVTEAGIRDLRKALPSCEIKPSR